MILRDLLDLVNKEKRNRVRVKAAQKFAVGMGVVAAVGVATGILFAPNSGKETREDMKKKVVNTLETIKEKVQETVETVKNSAAQTSLDASKAVHDIQGKTEGVKKDIKAGYQEIKKDINKTAENILDELKSVK
ncbi:MAG: YtxH domain-containing protein [Desulfitobacteriaceae bacterium]